MDGFANFVRILLTTNGLTHTDIYVRRSVEVPGWFRVEKKWDRLSCLQLEAFLVRLLFWNTAVA
jgi:hypothetical protein